MNDSQLNLNSIAESIEALHQLGALDKRVIDALLHTDGMVDLEHWMWDFKAPHRAEAHEVCEIIKDVVSFHNSFGGYIVFGVRDEATAGCRPLIGIEHGFIDAETLRDKVASYTDGTVIEIAYREIEVPSVIGPLCLGLLFVPKRKEVMPVQFTKNAAVAPGKNGKQAFKEGQTYLRRVDRCCPAVGSTDTAFLWSPRITCRPSAPANGLSLQSPPMLANNLPDKNLICSNFVGREDILQSLWDWMCVPLNSLKVLAGEGGQGKTSIAYSFAAEFARRPPPSYVQVLWLTAKKRQFNAEHDRFDVMENNYSDLRTLLTEIAARCGNTTSEVTDASETKLKSLCIEGLKHLPSLVVIDDVDSTSSDEQRKIAEVALSLAQSRSRFLLTTRTNVSFSSSVCIRVPGLSGESFRTFVESVYVRYGMAQPRPKDIQRLEDQTSGSPLLAESVIRLVKRGRPLLQALNEWCKEGGEACRDAALESELVLLSEDARLVLYCMALLGESSRAEIMEVVGFRRDARLDAAIGELQALFLVDAPKVTAHEPRFAIKPLVRLMVKESEKYRPVTYRRIQEDVHRQRTKVPFQGAVREPAIGAAISQAIAQLTANHPTAAVETMDAALRRRPGQGDLLAVMARCQVALKTPESLSEARRRFRQAYDAGNRRIDLLDHWYRAEAQAESWDIAHQIAEWALHAGDDEGEWRYRRAYANCQIAATTSDSEKDRLFSLYEQAYNDLQRSQRILSGVARDLREQECEELLSLIWRRLKGCAPRLAVSLYEFLFGAMKRGMQTAAPIEWLVELLEGFASSEAVSLEKQEARIAQAQEILTLRLKGGLEDSESARRLEGRMRAVRTRLPVDQNSR